MEFQDQLFSFIRSQYGLCEKTVTNNAWSQLLQNYDQLENIESQQEQNPLSNQFVQKKSQQLKKKQQRLWNDFLMLSFSHKLTISQLFRKFKISRSRIEQWILQLDNENCDMMPLFQKQKPSKRKYNDDHSYILSTFIKNHQHQKITLKALRKELLDQDPLLEQVNLTSIRKIMREQLNMRYKKVSLRSISASTKDNREHLKEAATIINSLLESNVTIYFIDEYNISEQDASCYNWSQKGKEDYLYVQPRKPSIHIIAAVCKDNLIHIQTQKETIKSDDFREFLSELILNIKKNQAITRMNLLYYFLIMLKFIKLRKFKMNYNNKCVQEYQIVHMPQNQIFVKNLLSCISKGLNKNYLNKSKILSIGLIKKTAKDISVIKFQQEFKLFHPLIKNIIYHK